VSVRGEPNAPPVAPDACAWDALRSGLWLDLALLFGLLVLAAARPERWESLYWIVLGTGLGKSVSTGLASFWSCRSRLRRRA
jgi:hypothetical protein